MKESIISIIIAAMLIWHLLSRPLPVPNIRWYNEFNEEITNEIVYYETAKCDHGVYYYRDLNTALTPAYKPDGSLITCYSKKTEIN